MAKKLLKWFLSLIIASISLSTPVGAYWETPEAGTSAKLWSFSEWEYPIIDYRVQKLQAYLNKRQAPLADYAELFVRTADAYQLDWQLVAAISGVESNFGKRIPPNSYNAWGWQNGEYKFESWKDGIQHVNQVLSEKYTARGLITPEQMAPVYAPPSSTWAGKVRYFYNEFDKVEVSADEQLAFRI